jgi:SH3-like domain-containing protein
MRIARLFGILAVTIMIAVVVYAAAHQYITAKQANIRENPSWLGKDTGAFFSYGDEVSVVSARGAWVQVSGNGQTGWIHQSVLSKKKLRDIRPMSTPRPDEVDVTLASKGFNEEVEAEYKKAHADIDFARVDRIEREWVFTPQESQAFLEEGEVNPPQGGQR